MPINTTILSPSAYGLTPGVNRNSLPFGLNPLLNPVFASMQALGTGVPQALGLLPSLFGGNNGSANSSTLASNNASGPNATKTWGEQKGCGGAGCSCGNKGSQSQGNTQSQDNIQRTQDSVSKQDSSGSGALPPAPPPSIFN